MLLIVHPDKMEQIWRVVELKPDHRMVIVIDVRASTHTQTGRQGGLNTQLFFM